MAGRYVWFTESIPKHQAESVEFSVPKGSVVTGFNLASYCEDGSKQMRFDNVKMDGTQMRIEEVKMDGTIGAVLFGWNHCGTHTYSGSYPDPSDYTHLSLAVATTATRFKISVRQTYCDGLSLGCPAGVAIFRVVGTSNSINNVRLEGA